MHAVFRADAGPAIGGGHVQRCLTLADAFAREGWTCTFACRDGTLETVPALRASGHRLMQLSGQEEREPSEIAAALNAPCDLLVVDHYQRGEGFETRSRAFAARILALDDQPRRRHDADFLLDATPRPTEADYRPFVPASCRLFIGPRYALLRPQFAKERSATLARRERNSEVRRVLVSMGMTDPGNVTSQVLHGIAASGFQFAVDVVLGATAPHIMSVRALIADLKLAATLHVDVTDMAALVSAADVAIGAAGQTSFERCCLGLPSLMVITADNQTQFARALAEAGAVESLCMPLDAARTAAALSSLAQDHARRQAMSRAAAALCDGEGAARATQAVGASSSKKPQKVMCL